MNKYFYAVFFPLLLETMSLSYAMDLPDNITEEDENVVIHLPSSETHEEQPCQTDKNKSLSKKRPRSPSLENDSQKPLTKKQRLFKENKPYRIISRGTKDQCLEASLGNFSADVLMEDIRNENQCQNQIWQLTPIGNEHHISCDVDRRKYYLEAFPYMGGRAHPKDLNKDNQDQKWILDPVLKKTKDDKEILLGYRIGCETKNASLMYLDATIKTTGSRLDYSRTEEDGPGPWLEPLNSSSENQIWMLYAIINAIDLDKDIIRDMVFRFPEILSRVGRTCKEWNFATKDLLEATNIVFKKISSYNLNTYYGTDKHNYIKPFKSGFNKLVFNLKGELDDQTIMVPTIKVLDYFFKKEFLKFPDSIKDHNIFPPYHPKSGSQKFNYLEALILSAKTEEVNNEILESFNKCFEQLVSFVDQHSKDDVFYQKVFRSKEKYSLNSFSELTEINENNPYFNKTFTVLREKMMNLYKLSLNVGKDYRPDYFSNPSSSKLHKKMQEISVSIEVKHDDIEKLKKEIKDEILNLAKKRWEAIEKLKFFGSFG